MSVVVFGGYGIFGGHVARELAKRGVPLTIAGRHADKARRFAKSLGPSADSLVADVMDRASCLAALRGKAIAVNCSGPFSDRSPLLDACLETGCHSVDIADDRAYAAFVRGHSDRFAAKGLLAAYGCSSLPGISEALALTAAEEMKAAPHQIRVVLSIGNKNPKGAAAIASALTNMKSGNFQSPEHDLFPARFPGLQDVTVEIAFELGPVNALFSLLTRVPPRFGRKLAAFLKTVSRPLNHFGSSGGAVRVELYFPDGAAKKLVLLAKTGGQRMAALPCVYVVESLLSGKPPKPGAATASGVLGAAALLDRLRNDGCDVIAG